MTPFPMSSCGRRRRPQDDALLALWSMAGENDDRTPDRAAAVRRLIEHDAGAVIVACRGEEIIASVIAGWDGWRASLYRLTVRPDHRRQGLAIALLAAAEERFARVGAERVAAMVLEGNSAGAGLWRAAGFEPQPRWRRWIRWIATPTR